MYFKPNRPLLSSLNKTSLTVGLLIGLCIGGGFSYSALSITNEQPKNSVSIADYTKTAVCFTPPRGCTNFIIKAMNKAKTSIFIQAYSLTCKDIAATLIKAHQQGIKVIVLADKGQIRAHHSQIHKLAKNGIPVYIDPVPGLAHNKIILIDNKVVITGSFNYSAGADTRNAENMLLIEDPGVAGSYVSNWQKRLKTAHSLPPKNVHFSS